MTQQFDELAALYEEMASWPFRKYCEIPSTIEKAGRLEGLSVLDFGCGSGFYTRLLKQHGAKKVVGYDISSGMVDYARRREEKEQYGITYTDNKDSIPSNHFDLVISVYILPYARNHKELVDLCQAMISPLKTGGRLITLPLHPNYSLTSSYYRPYGFDLISSNSTPRTDETPLQLHLCHPPYDDFVTAYYWREKTLTSALQQQGLNDIEWENFQVTHEGREILGDSFWEAYQSCPHSLIISGYKGRPTC
ncbi:class I SAM-dependent methyltransferase [Halomonas sp. THAF12]|uniref:class I SAM-dependent methyltransferase n=1 Tax=Halomonas sp. B23F22_10 TaxID=3459515 RepID=UPI00373ECFF3